MDPKTSGAGLRVVMLAVLALIVWYLGAHFDGTPAPRGTDAPAAEFSAARADAALGRLLGPEVAHPVSSKANQAVRDRIRAQFAALGVKTTVYRAPGCFGRTVYGFFACGTAEDIIAEVAPGAGKAIVMLAHYDSVPAGPGAADDQSGVATILETVRALKVRGLKSTHPIVAVITDGEEAGLLGAVAFTDNKALRDRVGVVVNVEARGNQGPSLLFQTSPGDAPLIDLYARSVPEYATSSLFAVIYKALPNDTDLTVFLNHGFTGFNYAFSGNVAQYHTALDRRENLSAATLQHHGDNLLGTVTGLMQTDFRLLKGGDAIYLTLFGHLLPRMKASWAVPLAIVTLALLIAAAWGSRGEVLGWGRRFAAFAIPLLAVLGCAGLGWCLFEIAAQISNHADPSFAYPIWLRIAFGFSTLAIMLLLARIASARMTALSVWFWFAGLGLIAAIFLPGISPYFLFPAFIAALVLLVQTRASEGWAEWLTVLAALPALAIFFGLSVQGESVEGLAIHPLVTIPLAFGAMTLLPALAARPLSRRALQRGGVFAPVLALIFAVIAGLQPAYSARAPLRLNVTFVDDHVAGKGYWSVDNTPVPAAMRAVMPFSSTPASVPLAFQRFYPAPAGPTRFPAPNVSVSGLNAGAGRTITLTFHASDDANRVVVAVPKDAGLVKASLDGADFVPAASSLNPFGTIIACVTDDCRTAAITLTFAARKPVTLTLGQQHYGIPADGARLVRARPATAVPSQNGDSTIVFGTLTIK
jgi:hypothetical protein